MVIDPAPPAAVLIPRRPLHIGVTGHREGNRAFDAHRTAVADGLTQMLDALSRSSTGDHGPGPDHIRVVTCLAHGADVMAAAIARDRAWQLQAPLPFGKTLNLALNTPHLTRSQIVAALDGNLPDDPAHRAHRAHRAHWDHLELLSDYAQCFELAEQDGLMHCRLAEAAQSDATGQTLAALDLFLAERAHAASLIMIEQSDVIIAVWDGSSPSPLGGTRDTINKALLLDVPVIWINPAAASAPQLLLDSSDLLALDPTLDSARDTNTSASVAADIHALARERWSAVEQADEQFSPGRWRIKSARRFHMYRRIEALFGGAGNRFASLVQRYENPADAAQGSAKPVMDNLRALPGADGSIIARIGHTILPRFAFADGLSTYLSDAYRGGMVASFLLSAAAIIAGVAYLPVVGPEFKWPFALTEFLLLVAIIAITVAGTRGNWHRRWFRTRRVAEYLRHAPIMITLGCTRALGRWPRSRDESWPEQDARMQIVSLGLPDMKVTAGYLRGHLDLIIKPFLDAQCRYHRAKSLRLERVHRNLDRMSEALFLLAVLSVGTYLLMELALALALIDPHIPNATSKAFTFLGVACPTLGAALAGIRYFGDFERFAAISDVTAAKLERLRSRAESLGSETGEPPPYRDYADLAHAINDVMIEEIESWQSIFGTKKMAVPV